MEYIKDICEIGEKVGKLLKEINRNEEIKVSDAAAVKQLMSIVQKSMDIEMMDEERNGGYSQGGDWMAEGTYGRGSSFANRGRHLVRAHYSHDGSDDSMRDGYSSRRDSRGRYSREDGRDKMIGHLKAAWDDAPEKDRQEFMRYLENA